MINIADVHEEVFNLLQEIRASEGQTEAPLFYTLRRENNYRRLDQKYWFHGNQHYMVVSFWSGMDWKNRTPNIFFRIKDDGETALHISVKDSIQKTVLVEEIFVKALDLLPDGNNRWIKRYPKRNYLQSLRNFLDTDKLGIDNLIRKNEERLVTEDVHNSIGFIAESNFSKWLQKINGYRKDADIKRIPFSLLSFLVVRFTPIDHLNLGSIPIDSRFVFLTGENGSGKTSLLRALAFALGNQFHKEEYNPSNSPWIISSTVNTPTGLHSFKINVEEPVSDLVTKIPFCCYGASRLTIQNHRYKSAKDDQSLADRMQPLRGLFENDAVLMDLNSWLINSLANKSKDNDKVRAIYEGIKTMLINVIPNLYDIREVPWDGFQELLYFEEDLDGVRMEIGVMFDNLSSGLKSMISMLGDMMIRLFDMQPEATEPSELCGIVLIDEIDIHLHPNWQRKLPELLDEYFPLIQFIITTHSPIPLLGAPESSRIFVVKRISKLGVTAERLDNKIRFENLLPNSLLTSPIFDLSEIIPDNNRNLTRLRTEDTYQEIVENDAVRAKLKAIAKKIRDEEDR